MERRRLRGGATVWLPPAGHRPTLGSFALVQIWREDVLDKWSGEWREKASAILRLVR